MTYNLIASLCVGAVLVGSGCSDFVSSSGTDGDDESSTLTSGLTTTGTTDIPGTSTTEGTTSSGTTTSAESSESTSSPTTGEESSSSGTSTESSSTGAEPDCGNGRIDDGEECDAGDDNSDAEADACRTDCSVAGCGDGVPDTGEACDAGDDNSDADADACRTDCSLAGCGDGVPDTGEACDAGDDNSDTEADACRTDCSLAGCGDGVPDTGEACDAGDDNSDADADACRTDCSLAGCGDGVVDSAETCDDGNASGDDGCSMLCAEELGFECSGQPSTCEAASILINGDFEDSSGGDPIANGNTFPFFFPGTALWFADLGTFVAAEAGITPNGGAQMLRFDATAAAAGGFGASNIQQAIDMAPYAALIADDRVTVGASSLFNRVSTATDSLFQVRVFAYSGDEVGGFTLLDSAQGDVLADLDEATWEAVEAELLLPPTTTFVVISLNAVENIENDTTAPEFAGHYADDADVRVVVAPPA